MNTNDYSDYIGREALLGGRWVMIEDADENGVDVTDQDGGSHSVSWSSLDFIGVEVRYAGGVA